MLRVKYLVIMVGLFSFFSCTNEKQAYNSYEDYPVYEEANLWLNYNSEFTEFVIWSPPAEQVKVNLYKTGEGGKSFEQLVLNSDQSGLWKKRYEGDLNGVYYTFQVKINGEWLDETPGIYAKAVGVNGKRAMVLDMKSTNPPGWEGDKGPQLDKPNEAILYELHIRDLTIHPNAGSSFPGKYMGLVEEGTTGPKGVSTAFDHIKELGVTHVHLLPTYDHYAIDETQLDSAQFNWGYDPQNYNVPEGSFSSDPYNAELRINEFKSMVQKFHENGIGVVLDVVYNHTGRTDESNFNLEVPGYYYRHNEDGSWSNASGCGNETASERIMMRKFMIESVLYWAKEYHLDGFRFDLMGIHDIETMNAVAVALKEFNPNILVYGEGWTAGDSPLPDKKKALKKNTYKIKDVSAFSDDIRDGLKGSVFEDKNTGFVSGAEEMEETIKFGVVGSGNHDQINYKAVNYSDTAWSVYPWQAVSYVSCHDNHTLYDKLTISRSDANAQQIEAMHKLANAVVMTSQGIPFLHAGVEIKRTKSGDHNSYNKPDSINQIDWQWKVNNYKVFKYYQALIHLRKNHPAFYMQSAEMIQENLRFFDTEPGLVGYKISNNANGDPWKEILVYYNANPEKKEVKLKGTWKVAILGNIINETGTFQVKGAIAVPSISMMVLYKE